MPFISLDTLCWKPGWQKSTTDEMRAKVEQALANASNGWLVDSNYKHNTIIEDNATDVSVLFFLAFR